MRDRPHHRSSADAGRSQRPQLGNPERRSRRQPDERRGPRRDHAAPSSRCSETDASDYIGITEVIRPGGRSRARRHCDHPQRKHREQRDQEQRVKRHVRNPLAERDRELKQQVVAAGEVQHAPGAGAQQRRGAVERGGGHGDDEGVADAAEDIGRDRGPCRIAWGIHDGEAGDGKQVDGV